MNQGKYYLYWLFQYRHIRDLRLADIPPGGILRLIMTRSVRLIGVNLIYAEATEPHSGSRSPGPPAAAFRDVRAGIPVFPGRMFSS